MYRHKILSASKEAIGGCIKGSGNGICSQRRHLFVLWRIGRLQDIGWLPGFPAVIDLKERNISMDWNDLTPEQKIEHLWRLVSHLQSNVAQLRRELDKLRDED
jgi:hypothetical protein